MLWPSHRAPQPGADREIFIGGAERRQAPRHSKCVQNECSVAGWKIRPALAAFILFEANRERGRTQGVLGVNVGLAELGFLFHLVFVIVNG